MRVVATTLMGALWARIGVAALALAAALAPPAWSETSGSAIKAAYLYKFAPFVAWPPTAFASPTSPLRLCILGDDPFGALLDQTVDGQAVDSHPIQVRRVQGQAGAAGCQIVYFHGPRSGPAIEAFARLRGVPVLTVSDADADADGAVIRFVERDGRIRFAIDEGAAAANGVRISSKLLSLAVPMRPGS